MIIRKKGSVHVQSFLFVLLLIISRVHASCPSTTPWSTPVQLTNTGAVTSNIYSAGNSAGFMVVWADGSNNAQYSFSSDGTMWNGGLITPTEGNVATNSDIFVAGNGTGFVATWIDNANNGWSSFSADNGATWSDALQINPNTLSLNSNSDVYVGGGSSGFVATLIGSDNNAYVSFSTGTEAWSIPTQVTNDGSVYDQNWNSATTRGFVTVAIEGESCMVTWISNLYPTYSAYFETINPFSSTTVYPIAAIGFFESVPSVAVLNSYYMAVSRANEGQGESIFSVATIPSNWAIFSLFASPNDPQTGPWVAANQRGFMSSWVVGAGEGNTGSPMWTFTENNGFNWTPLCPILATESTTITGPIGLSANNRGFIASWLDTNDDNAYVSFYAFPVAGPTSHNPFVTLLEQKYGPLL